MVVAVEDSGGAPADDEVFGRTTPVLNVPGLMPLLLPLVLPLALNSAHALGIGVSIFSNM